MEWSSIMPIITSIIALIGVVYSVFRESKTENIKTIITASENFRKELREELSKQKNILKD